MRTLPSKTGRARTGVGIQRIVLTGATLLAGLGDALAANDDFNDADKLVGNLPIVENDENRNESAEPGEPDHDFNSITQNSIWWHWTPSTDTAVEINTFGSTPTDPLPGLQFDTVLAVYTGSSINNIVKVVGNDDTPDPSNGNTKQSLIRFIAQSNTKYYIVVDGYSGDSGNVRLNLLNAPTPRPANDNLADAVDITGNLPWDNDQSLPSPSGPLGTNVNGTVEELEPQHVSEDAFSSSIWYRWDATADGAVSATTALSDFDTVLAVYTGTGLGDLTRVTDNDDIDGSNPQSLCDFFASLGNTYFFAVDGFSDLEGEVRFRLEFNSTNLSNDPVNSAADITPREATAPFAPLPFQDVNFNQPSSGATIEPGEPAHHADIPPSSSIWFLWTAPSDVPTSIEMNTYGSNFDTILAVYTGSPFGGFTKIASNNDAGGLQSRLRFSPLPGQEYRIAIAGNQGAQGAAFLNIITGPTPPPNDDFVNATAMGNGSFASGSNAGATVQFGEPDHVPAVVNYGTVWYSWNASLSARYRIRTVGSTFDTTLAVYAGQAVDALTQLSSNDNAGGFTSQLTFDATNGQTYYIAVGGKDLAEGDVLLEIESVGSYAHWLEDNPALSGLAQERWADADGDGYANLIELLCGLDPTVNSRPEVGEDPNASRAPSASFMGGSVVETTFTIDPTYVNVERNGGAPITFSGQVLGEGLVESSLVTPANTGGDDYTVTADFSGSPIGKLRVIVTDPNSD